MLSLTMIKTISDVTIIFSMATMIIIMMVMIFCQSRKVMIK